jgi:hypothetical protein
VSTGGVLRVPVGLFLINQKINRVLNEISLADLSDPETMKRISLELESLENRPIV